MMKLRRGVGMASRISHILLENLSCPSRGRLRPRTADTTPLSRLYTAANRMSHRRGGSAATTISGARNVAAQMTVAFTMTMKMPIVERSSRPVKATTTGRTMCSERTRKTPVRSRAGSPLPVNWNIGTHCVPNGNGCGTEISPRTRTQTMTTTDSTRVSTMKRRIRQRPPVACAGPRGRASPWSAWALGVSHYESWRSRSMMPDRRSLVILLPRVGRGIARSG